MVAPVARTVVTNWCAAPSENASSSHSGLRFSRGW